MRNNRNGYRTSGCVDSDDHFDLYYLCDMDQLRQIIAGKCYSRRYLKLKKGEKMKEKNNREYFNKKAEVTGSV